MKYFLIAVIAALPAWTAATAQDSGAVHLRVGLGAKLEPQFIGADKDVLAPLFHIKIARGNNEFSFTAPDDSPSLGVVSSHGFSAGPAVNMVGPRKNSDVGAPVGRVARTYEAGAFAQYEARDSFRVRAELLKGINGHDGVVGSVGVDKIWRDGNRYLFSIGPRLLFSDARYQRAYFGVSPAASLATGLPIYRPGGGIHAVALASGMSYQFDKRWGVFGFARYGRLIGNAARSPIIREFGSRNQMSAGIGVNYSFDIHLD